VPLALWLAWNTVRATLRPVQLVTQSAQAIGRGNLDQVVPILSDDELGQLAGAFNSMVRQLREYRQADLARLLRAQSRVGQLFDPIADKLLVASAILILVHAGGIGRYDIIPAATILCREILVSGLREFLARDAVNLPVNKYGKVKTGVQMTAIFLLLLGVEGPSLEPVVEGATLSELLGRILLWVAGAMTAFSGYVYLRAGLKHIN
jgi:cardiolipin synthase